MKSAIEKTNSKIAQATAALSGLFKSTSRISSIDGGSEFQKTARSPMAFGQDLFYIAHMVLRQFFKL